MVERIAVTGGNGMIGEATVRHLSHAGYRTVNLARGKRREDVADGYRTTDLTVAGEVYGSLARSGADAVVHMGTIPHPEHHPGHVTYLNNVASTYHVLEAATELGLERVVLASSINVLGCYWQEARIDVDYLPVDEAHPCRPRDPYSLAKHAMEVTADGVGRLDAAPGIVSLRLPWVVDDETLRDEFADPERTLPTVGPEDPAGLDGLFSYLHLDDAARAARRAIEADTPGHEAVWTVAADTSMDVPSADLVDVYDYAAPEVRRSLDGHEALIDCSKAERLLDWTPERSWRDL